MSYLLNNFSQCSISINSNNPFLLTWGNQQITKALLFGSDYIETSTQVIINKSILLSNSNINNHAEAILVGLIKRWLSFNFKLGKIEFEYSSISFLDNQKIITVWIKFFEKLPIDNFNNPDMSTPFSPNNF